MSEQPVGRIEQLTFTAGPWDTETTTLDICRGIVSVEEVRAVKVHPVINPNRAIAYVPLDYRTAEQEANAQLIGAVPEVLAALREMVAIFDGTRDLLGATVAAKLARAEAAIARAEGRP